ncbi:MAG: hypothetical protein LBQ55_10725 [Treponema sp.]|jgi:hypothetical protein|nr:hypothetical protein [Treponema sp.]
MTKNKLVFHSGCLFISGLLFALYPALRPFSDEKSLEGAAAFASLAWFAAHLMAVLAFILLPFGLAGVCRAIQDRPARRSARRGFGLGCFGIGLTLPFYGAEMFGLQAVGGEALKTKSAALLSLADQIRYGKGFVLICAGLLLLAAGIIVIAAALWKSRALNKWSGIPLAAGFLLYLPQYMMTQPWRVLHGLLISAGCIWLGLLLLRPHELPRRGES